MSGVIGLDGVQWERCNSCAGWTELTKLYYEEPSSKFTCGRDLCVLCAYTKSKAKVRKPGGHFVIRRSHAHA